MKNGKQLTKISTRCRHPTLCPTRTTNRLNRERVNQMDRNVCEESIQFPKYIKIEKAFVKLPPECSELYAHFHLLTYKTTQIILRWISSNQIKYTFWHPVENKLKGWLTLPLTYVYHSSASIWLTFASSNKKFFGFIWNILCRY